MAVTDLTGSLPWWLQGPGPTGAPTTQPQGSGGGAQSWLDYLYNMVNPVSSAQADSVSQNQQLNGLLAARANGVAQPNSNNAIDPAQALSGAAGPMRPPNTMDIAPGTQSSASLGAYNRMPFPGQRDAVGVFAPRPGPQGPPVGAGLPDQSGVPRVNGVLSTDSGRVNPTPVGTPAGPGSSSGGASAMGATSNPRFTPIDSPNLSAAGMGSRGAPQMSALNLAGLFRGGGGASNAPAAASPSGGAATPVPGPLGSPRGAPWSMGPMQRGMTFPSAMGPFTADQMAARGLRQRYG